jgi:hypothetical protein
LTNPKRRRDPDQLTKSIIDIAIYRARFLGAVARGASGSGRVPLYKDGSQSLAAERVRPKQRQLMHPFIEVCGRSCIATLTGRADALNECGIQTPCYGEQLLHPQHEWNRLSIGAVHRAGIGI